MNYDFLLIYLAIINLIAVIVCVFDKISAKHKSHRVSEKTLFSLCILGGSVTMYITMHLIRHKTLHKRFMIGIPLIIVLQIAVAMVLVTR